MLTNDHKALSSRIETLLHELHGQASTSGSSRPAPAPPAQRQTPLTPPVAEVRANGRGRGCIRGHKWLLMILAPSMNHNVTTIGGIPDDTLRLTDAWNKDGLLI